MAPRRRQPSATRKSKLVPGHTLAQVLSACCRADRNTTAESAKVLNNAAELIRGAFSWAKDYAFVDGCVGVEFPLKTPPVAGNISLLEVHAFDIERRKPSC